MTSSQGKTGLDQALNLDAIYYSAPVPRDLPTLTVLGTVFDKVYFPHVYMPTSGFDQKELDKEITRIVEVTRDAPTRNENLPGILSFVRHAKTLEGFCVFTGNSTDPFQSDADITTKMLNDMYEAIHGPSKPGWTPMFSGSHHKAMPGSDEHVTYPGDYHYLAGAFLHSARTGLPLLCDIPGLPIPMITGGIVVNKAKQLSTLLAIECVKLALPELPLLRPEDLMEFRAENVTTLRAFRGSMLKCAGDLATKIGTAGARDIEEATKFYVDTEIVPALDELRAKLNAPARPWHKRAIDFVRVAPKVIPSFFTMNPATILSSVLSNFAPQFFTELDAIGDKHESLKRSGLYYLLRLETFQAEAGNDRAA